MPRASTLLRGHALRNEGAPFRRWNGDDHRGLVYVFESWEGLGACECGATSGVLPSNRARKAWHREHKEKVRTEEGTGHAAER